MWQKYNSKEFKPKKEFIGSQSREIQAYATIWMNLKDIFLYEISYLQKDKYSMIPHL